MDQSNPFDLFQANGPAYLNGPTYLGAALDQTGQLTFYNASSAKSTVFQAGNATADATYIYPTAAPAGNGYILASTTAGVLSWLNSAGTYAPIGSAFVTIGNDSTLTSERALTGTSNQIVITDNGAGSTVVLSTPQNIHTGASPTFVGGTFTGTLDGQGLLKGKGTATNDSPAAGYIGEVISSAAAAVSSGSNGVWADVTSITLTGGHWLIVGQVIFTINSAGTVTQVQMGISTTSGNSTTGLTDGDTRMENAPPTNNNNSSATIAALEAKLTGSTTYYLKHVYNFSSGTYKSSGRITAVRIS